MDLLQSLQSPGRTFQDVADTVLLQALKTHPAAGHRSARIDFVVDIYPSVSTKAYERTSRSAAGTARVRISNSQQSCPRQWKKFLSADETSWSS